MKLPFDLDRKQAGWIAGALALIWVYFSLVTGPNSDTLSELNESVETKRKQLNQIEQLALKLSECDKLMAGHTDSPQSIETRVEKVGRDLSLQPTIRKLGDGSLSEPNKVEVRLANLYLRQLVEFMRRVEAFPVTVQIVKVDVTKQGNVASLALILSDLNI
jgi:type II secretory pathway component PulM